VGNRASDVFSDQPHADSGYRRADSALNTRLPLSEQLIALHTLQSELERLQYRVRHGAPWYQRFGLERNTQLLDAAFPGYAQAASRLVRDVALSHLQQQLNAFVALPPDSPQRTATSEQRYKQLKALLMMSRPEKADAAFFSATLMADGLRYPGGGRSLAEYRPFATCLLGHESG
jgi:type VI secretion system protein ImpL